jgi:mono/diheme cytochrome c family protein
MKSFLPIAAVMLAFAAAFAGATPGRAQSDALVERGRYLVNGIAGCGNCHTMQGPNGPVQGMDLAGGLEMKDRFFTAWSSNITPDVETGIGRWTDEQIINGIREGRRPDGSAIGLPMPFRMYRMIADSDVKAMVAYLRTVPAIRNKVPASNYLIPIPPRWGPAVRTATPPNPADRVAYGAYLAGPLGHCVECHSGTNLFGIPDVENRLGAGGLEFPGPWGTAVAPNITPTNLGSWTDQQIITAITQGVRPDGRRLGPPMGYRYYATMTKSDLEAIVAWLRSLPPK